MKIFARPIFVMVLVASIFSVRSHASELSVGGRLGLNFASILGDTSSGVSPKVGLTGGIFAAFWLNNASFLQAELILGLKGEAVAKNEALSNPNFATSLSYLEIPILYGRELMNKDQFQTSIFAGIVPAFNLGSESVYGGGSIDMKDQTQSFDLGLTIGATICLKRGKSYIPVDLRYTYGTLRFDKTNNTPLNNSVISLTVGFGSEIQLKKEESF